MAVARGVNSIAVLKLWRSASIAATASLRRHLSTSTPYQTPAPRATSIRRFMPTDLKFVTSDGKLQTTRENIDFLAHNNLEHDNGVMMRVYGSREFQKATTNAGIVVGYSPKYVIHPYDLKYFDPRGHALAGKIRSKYLQKLADEPLWVMTTASGGLSAVARILPQRIVKGALFRALKEMGFASGTGPDGTRLSGTLWLVFHEPLKAARQDEKALGRAIAKAAIEACR